MDQKINSNQAIVRALTISPEKRST